MTKTNSWARDKTAAQSQVTAKKPSQQQCMTSKETGNKGFWAADAWFDYQIRKTAHEMSPYISQKQHVTTGNEAVLDTSRFQVALHLVGELVLRGCKSNTLHSLKIGQNLVQNPIAYNFLVHICCLFVYNQETKTIQGYYR